MKNCQQIANVRLLLFFRFFSPTYAVCKIENSPFHHTPLPPALKPDKRCPADQENSDYTNRHEYRSSHF